MNNKVNHYNFFVDDVLKRKIKEIQKEYNLSKLIRNLLDEFHQEKYGK